MGKLATVAKDEHHSTSWKHAKGGALERRTKPKPKTETELVAAIEIRCNGPMWIATVAIGTTVEEFNHPRLKKAIKAARLHIDAVLASEQVTKDKDK